MKYKIVHETEYLFDKEVFLEPHFLRFKPKSSPFLSVETFNLIINPIPAGLVEQLDEENNSIHFCWFDGMNTKLKIKAESIIKAIDFNPLNSILYPTSVYNLPFEYTPQAKQVLGSSLNKIDIPSALKEYGAKICQDSTQNTITFLMNLTIQIHQDFKVESRELGEPWEPLKTFEGKTGSCRDLAWMQIQLLRNMGLAARFVSGYYFVEAEHPEFELHGWTEVFLPGTGWIGLDPSNGILTTHAHIPVTSSAQFEKTMPVSGTTRGNSVGVLTNTLLIELLKD